MGGEAGEVGQSVEGLANHIMEHEFDLEHSILTLCSAMENDKIYSFSLNKCTSIQNSA